jgi:hypothetical protein
MYSFRQLRLLFLGVCIQASCVDSSSCQVLDPDWRIKDVGFATKPSFDFDAQGRVHVMGMTEAFNGVVWYDVADSIDGPWDPQTLQSGYFYGPGDLRVDSAGNAHIAYHDHDRADARHVVVEGDGTVIPFTISSPSHDGWDNALAFDSQGQLHQSSVDPSSFGAVNSLQYSQFDGAEWQMETIAGSGSFMYGFNTSLALDSSDQPHIVYTGATGWTAPGDLKYAHRTGEGWQISSIVSDGIRGRFPSLAIDAQDRAHVGWLDIDENDHARGFVRYGMMENGIWSVETVDTLENIELGFSGGRKQVSLALDDAGDVHLAYGDKRVVKYAQRADSTWQSTTVVQTSEDFYNGLVVLRLNPMDESPAITFWQPNPIVTGVVWLAALDVPGAKPGDFDEDGELTAADINDLFAAVRDESTDGLYDVDGDGAVTAADSEYWIEQLAATHAGDANLDQAVDATDFDAWHANVFVDGTGWELGDFNGDGLTDVSDFNLWSQNRSAAGAAEPVPEPAAILLVVWLGLGVLIRRRLGPLDE